MSKRVSQKLKDKLAKRARYYCEYCYASQKFSSDPFCIEHIIPISKGGNSEQDNLALAYSGCNNHKYTHTEAIDPISGISVPLFHPRKDKWQNHFARNNDKTLILGISPIGRATIERLNLNRKGLQHQRRLLALAGEHPADK